MTMRLWYFSLRSFTVSFFICQVLQNQGSVLGYAGDDDARVVYYTLPSTNVRTVLISGSAMFGVDLKGRTPIESHVSVVEPPKGCSDLSNSEAVNGKIALVNRGDCLFIEKARHIQNAGGLAGIVIDNNPGISSTRTSVLVMHHGYKADDVTIPMVFLFSEEADQLLSAYNQYPDLVVGVADVAPVGVSGHWSPWSEWSPCPVTCGTAEIQRNRSCDNPPPSSGGFNCTGNSTEEEICDTGVPCPVNGNWSRWSEWSSCPVTCGRAAIQRFRSCDNPPPVYGGSNCTGNSTEEEMCDTGIACPVNGNWSRWSAWSSCPVTCGRAAIQRFRSCDNPPPAYGGSNCTGNSTEEEMCDTGIACPAAEKQHSLQRSEEVPGGENQLSPGYISLIAISVIVLTAIIVSAVTIYYFCPPGKKTETEIKFSVLK